MTRSSIASAAALLAVLFLGSAEPARGQQLVFGTDIETIAEIARGYGRVEIEKDDRGDPMLTGRIDGMRYGVWFYGCVENENCTSLQFFSFWSDTGATVVHMNDWNDTKRWGKAYLDDEANAVLALDVNLFAGVPHDNLDDTFEWWTVLMKDFRDFLGKLK